MVWTWNIKKLKSLFKSGELRCMKMEKKRKWFRKQISWSIKRKKTLVEQIASKEFEIENLQETIVDLNDKLVNNGF
jgi:hypothetical protein